MNVYQKSYDILKAARDSIKEEGSYHSRECVDAIGQKVPYDSPACVKLSLVPAIFKAAGLSQQEALETEPGQASLPLFTAMAAWSITRPLLSNRQPVQVQYLLHEEVLEWMNRAVKLVDKISRDENYATDNDTDTVRESLLSFAGADLWLEKKAVLTSYTGNSTQTTSVRSRFSSALVAMRCASCRLPSR